MTHIRIIDTEGGHSLGRFNCTFLPSKGHTVAIGSKRYIIVDVIIVYNIKTQEEDSISIYVENLNKGATRIVNEMLNGKSSSLK